ncbi:MAG: hypothetical protein ACRCWQ_09205 [Bacilli bacterium]
MQLFRSPSLLYATTLGIATLLLTPLLMYFSTQTDYKKLYYDDNYATNDSFSHSKIYSEMKVTDQSITHHFISFNGKTEIATLTLDTAAEITFSTKTSIEEGMSKIIIVRNEKMILTLLDSTQQTIKLTPGTYSIRFFGLDVSGNYDFNTNSNIPLTTKNS